MLEADAAVLFPGLTPAGDLAACSASFLLFGLPLHYPLKKVVKMSQIHSFKMFSHVPVEQENRLQIDCWSNLRTAVKTAGHTRTFVLVFGF